MERGADGDRRRGAYEEQAEDPDRGCAGPEDEHEPSPDPIGGQACAMVVPIGLAEARLRPAGVPQDDSRPPVHGSPHLPCHQRRFRRGCALPVPAVREPGGGALGDGERGPERRRVGGGRHAKDDGRDPLGDGRIPRGRWSGLRDPPRRARRRPRCRARGRRPRPPVAPARRRPWPRSRLHASRQRRSRREGNRATAPPRFGRSFRARVSPTAARVRGSSWLRPLDRLGAGRTSRRPPAGRGTAGSAEGRPPARTPPGARRGRMPRCPPGSGAPSG